MPAEHRRRELRGVPKRSPAASVQLVGRRRRVGDGGRQQEPRRSCQLPAGRRGWSGADRPARHRGRMLRGPRLPTSTASVRAVSSAAAGGPSARAWASSAPRAMVPARRRAGRALVTGRLAGLDAAGQRCRVGPAARRLQQLDRFQGAPGVRRAVDAAEWLDLGQRHVGQELGPVHERLENGFAALVVVVGQLRAGGGGQRRAESRPGELRSSSGHHAVSSRSRSYGPHRPT